jgi:hypothetical protein
MRAALAGLIALFVLAGLARSDDQAACTGFAWPLDTEKAWFAATDLRTVPNGETISTFADGAIKLELEELSAAELPKAPERAPKPPDLQAGFITFTTLPTAGTLQVTLTGEGWIDMIQNGAYLQAKEHTGKRDCPGLRKSVRFAVKPEALIIQISGAAKPEIGIALRYVD